MNYADPFPNGSGVTSCRGRALSSSARTVCSDFTFDRENIGHAVLELPLSRNIAIILKLIR